MPEQGANQTSARPEQPNLRDSLLYQRYLRKDEAGRVIETPEAMFRRVAESVAQAESAYGHSPAEIRDVARRFEAMMHRGVFLPNSPTLMNAGRTDGSLSGCFVLPVPDSVDGIFEAIKDTALIQKAGGGTGFAFDELRPTGDLVASSGGKTSGPMSFMRTFAESTSAIQQGAFRRGANMGMMNIGHPDILKFVDAKSDLNAFDNFNFSVKVSDDFMKRLSADPDAPHIVTNPRTGRRYVIPRAIDVSRYTIDDLQPADGTFTGPVYAVNDVWRMIVARAHASGEPGVCYIDRIKQANPTPHLGRIEATNPCGEQPLLPYESCNLGSIDLSKFIDPEGNHVRWDELKMTVAQAVRFLDDVIDVNQFPTVRTADVTRGNRKIGLGVMGFADALVLLGLRYDSEQAVGFARQMSHFVTASAHDASEALAHERGCLPNWEGSTWDTDHHRPMRNAACTTIAPTGSISIIAGCSSGIEPIYSLTCRRRALDGGEFVVIHPMLEQLGRREGWLDDRVRRALLKGVTPDKIRGFPARLTEVLVTAHDVAPEWHVRVQAAFQDHIDSAVSKTVNLPASATVDDVDRVFRMAFELGCKGITVYRDSSREGQTLALAGEAEKESASGRSRPRPRPRLTSGSTSKFRMGCGTLFVTVNRDDRGLCEVFANLGKAGGCPSQTEATCRAVSAALRSGVDPDVLIEQLRGIRCLSAARKGNGQVDVLSCPDAIARAMAETMGRSVNAADHDLTRRCPDCGSELRTEAGCLTCVACGYTKCG